MFWGHLHWPLGSTPLQDEYLLLPPLFFLWHGFKPLIALVTTSSGYIISGQVQPFKLGVLELNINSRLPHLHSRYYIPVDSHSSCREQKVYGTAAVELAQVLVWWIVHRGLRKKFPICVLFHPQGLWLIIPDFSVSFLTYLYQTPAHGFSLPSLFIHIWQTRTNLPCTRISSLELCFQTWLSSVAASHQ